MSSQTDERIIAWIRENIRQGAKVVEGETVSGRIPESGLFYGGAERGMIEFEHTVSREDLRLARC